MGVRTVPLPPGIMLERCAALCEGECRLQVLRVAVAPRRPPAHTTQSADAWQQANSWRRQRCRPVTTETGLFVCLWYGCRDGGFACGRSSRYARRGALLLERRHGAACRAAVRVVSSCRPLLLSDSLATGPTRAAAWMVHVATTSKAVRLMRAPGRSDESLSDRSMSLARATEPSTFNVI